MTQPFDTAAIEMFRAAGVKPSTNDVVVLSDDLRAIADEEWGEDYDETDAAINAAGILRTRIGGFTALRGYVDCLLAGKNRVGGAF